MIDAHHHLWKYDPAEYGWIGENMKVLRRDFLPPDLHSVLSASGVDGAVAVQARQTIEETSWLLDLAEQHPFMRGVVGWLPLASPDAARHIERFAGRWKLRGIRHVVQDEPDDDFILGSDFNRGVSLLKGAGLVYDILIYERHLPQAIRFVDRHPGQVFVLDHIAKPRIRASQGDAALSPWRENLLELARRENVYCKLSGMVTEADWSNWTPESLRPYFDAALEAFGPRRLMFGSDWPVLLLAADYPRWLSVVESFVSAAERERIMSGTAIEAYRL